MFLNTLDPLAEAVAMELQPVATELKPVAMEQQLVAIELKLGKLLIPRRLRAQTFDL
jgi:hypothetical protein